LPLASLRPMVKPGPTLALSFVGPAASARLPTTSPAIAAAATASRSIRLPLPGRGAVGWNYDRWPRPVSLLDREVEPLTGRVVRREVAEQDVVPGLERDGQRLGLPRRERVDLPRDRAREDGRLALQ